MTPEQEAKDPQTPPKRLRELSQDFTLGYFLAMDYVRKRVAKNPSTSAIIIERLCSDTSTDVVEAVLGHPSVSSSVLASFASSSLMGVRMAVAMHTNTPEEALLTLARDTELMVRYSLSNNKALPVSVWALLSRDEDSALRVACALRANLSLAEQVLLSKDTRTVVRACIAHNAAPDILAQLVDDEEELVREAVTNTPKHLIVRLSQDTDETVRLAAQKSLAEISKKQLGGLLNEGDSVEPAVKPLDVEGA